MKVEYRGRAHTRHGNRRMGKLQAVFVIALTMLVGSCFCLLVLDQRISSMVEQLGSSRAQSIANLSITRAIEQELSENGVSYEDLITMEKDSMGNVKALSTNIIKINHLQARITERVENNLESEIMSIDLPVGNLLNVDLLSGRGPMVNFKLMPFGSVNVTMQNEFVDAGINQTLHRIYLTVKSGVNILLPVSTLYSSIETRVCIAETVIVGTVPESYTHVTDASEWTQDKLFNFGDE